MTGKLATRQNMFKKAGKRWERGGGRLGKKKLGKSREKCRKMVRKMAE